MVLNRDIEKTSHCFKAFFEYGRKSHKLKKDLFAVKEEIEDIMRKWLMEGDKEVEAMHHYNSVLMPSFLKKKVVKPTKELNGEDIIGIYTILNKGEAFNESHWKNILVFSTFRLGNVLFREERSQVREA